MPTAAGTPVVIDVGSQWTRVGFARESVPKVIIPSASVTEQSPVNEGLVTDWAALEAVLRKAYEKLGVAPGDGPVLVAEPVNTPPANREKIVQLLFEKFGVPAVYLAPQATLALYATGRETGVVVESGHGVTQVVPVSKGYAVSGAMYTSNFAGRFLTDYLAKLVKGKDEPLTPEVAASIKERLCYVEVDAAAGTQGGPDKEFQLPDGTQLSVSSQAYRLPEYLISPAFGMSEEGLPRRIHEAIQKCDASIHEALYGAVVLSGGNTRFHGLKERVTAELTALAAPGTAVHVSTPSTEYAVWVGGSVLASLDTFQEMWLTRAKYTESGPSAIHDKCVVAKPV